MHQGAKATKHKAAFIKVPFPLPDRCHSVVWVTSTDGKIDSYVFGPQLWQVREETNQCFSPSLCLSKNEKKNIFLEDLLIL